VQRGTAFRFLYEGAALSAWYGSSDSPLSCGSRERVTSHQTRHLRLRGAAFWGVAAVAHENPLALDSVRAKAAPRPHRYAKRCGRGPPGSRPNIRSTYFAIRSNSRFTRSPGFR
jgi:hypothetical protein